MKEIFYKVILFRKDGCWTVKDEKHDQILKFSRKEALKRLKASLADPYIIKAKIVEVTEVVVEEWGNEHSPKTL